MAQIIKSTATVAKSGKIYAFGKSDAGYFLAVKKSTYNGSKRGGMDTFWAIVSDKMTRDDSVAMMNKKCGYVAFH
jgi:hypothetical protein